MAKRCIFYLSFSICAAEEIQYETGGLWYPPLRALRVLRPGAKHLTPWLTAHAIKGFKKEGDMRDEVEDVEVYDF